MESPPRSAEAWARVRLLSGRSPGQEWEVNSAVPNARVDVGSHPRCAWQVDAPGVAARHFEFYWDGQVLWAADLFAAGGVRVDHEPLSAWRALTGRCRIEFGQAAMLIDTSAAAALGSQERPFEPREETGEEQVKTQIAFSPFEKSASGESDTGSSTRALETSAELANQPTRMLHQGDLSPQATLLVPAPSDSLSDAHLPRPGAGTHRVPPPVAVAVVEPPVKDVSDARGPSSGAACAPIPASPASTMSSPSTPFAMPPTQVTTAVTKKKAAVPIRTWILLGLAVAVALYVAFSAPTSDPPPTAVVERDETPAPSPSLPDAATSSRDASVVPPTAPVLVIHAPGREDGGEDGVDVMTPRKAVELLVAGHLEDALRAYGELAALNSGDETYRTIAKILERRLRQRCHNGVDIITGDPC